MGLNAGNQIMESSRFKVRYALRDILNLLTCTYYIGRYVEKGRGREVYYRVPPTSWLFKFLILNLCNSKTSYAEPSCLDKDCASSKVALYRPHPKVSDFTLYKTNTNGNHEN